MRQTAIKVIGMEGFHIAQINISRLVAPLDDPRIAEFVAELAPINELADRATGFVWRLQSEAGDASDIAYSDDPFAILNMSVWKTVEDLRQFTYRSRHIEIFRKRLHWFEKSDQPSYCLWWVAKGVCRRLPKESSGWNTIASMAPLHMPFGLARSFLRLSEFWPELAGSPQ